MNDDIERRVQDAVTAHGRTVQPDDDGSLAVIRHRLATARRRRLVGATALGAAAALVIGVAIGIAAGGDDATTVAVGDANPSTTTSPCPEDTPLTGTRPPSTSVAAQGGSTSMPTTSTVTTTAPDSAEAGGAPTTSSTFPETTIPAGSAEEDIIGESEELAEDNGAADCSTPTTGTRPPSTPSTPTTTTTTTIGSELPQVVFPINGLVPPDQPWPWPDPESTARGFFEAVGVVDPAVGAFEETGPDVGRIRLHGRDEGGVLLDLVRSTLELGKVDGHWAVLEASSPSIVIDGLGIEATEPGSPVLVMTGRGRGFEGTLHVRVLGHGDIAFERSAVVTASGGEELIPFRAEIDMTGSSGQWATIVVSNDSGLDGSPVDVSALPFRLP